MTNFPLVQLLCIMESPGSSVTEALTELDYRNMSRKKTSGVAQAMASISDLPDDILKRILLRVCVYNTLYSRVDGDPMSVFLLHDPGGRKEQVCKRRVRSLSSVCTRWRDVLLSQIKRVSRSLEEEGSANRALRELHSLRSVTHVSVYGASGNKVTRRFLRGLVATGFPLLTSLHITLTLSKDHAALDQLSLFLYLKTNFQEMYVAFRYVGSDDSYDDDVGDMLESFKFYCEILEDMDFAPQARLKRLTLNYLDLSIFSKRLDTPHFPVSTSLARLASLEELCLRLHTLKMPLPPWLAELPAFVGLRISLPRDLPPQVEHSVRLVTGLRELSIQCYEVGAREMDLVSRMTRLTALQLHSSAYSRSTGLATSQGTLRLGPSPTLRKLDISVDVVPKWTGLPLLLLEDLTLSDTAAVQPDYFAFTPNLRKLDVFLSKGMAWPRLEFLSQLTSLSVDLDCTAVGDVPDVPNEEPQQPMWHVGAAPLAHVLQTLELRTCQLLPLLGGLHTLERHVVVLLRCTCNGIGFRGSSWYDSHAKYAAAAAEGRPCRRLPAGDARQLFKDTRRPAQRPPPSFTLLETLAAPLRPWLPALPSLVGLRVCECWDLPPLIEDSVRSVTGPLGALHLLPRAGRTLQLRASAGTGSHAGKEMMLAPWKGGERTEAAAAVAAAAAAAASCGQSRAIWAAGVLECAQKVLRRNLGHLGRLLPVPVVALAPTPGPAVRV
eukprot:jgi/Mesen1/3667/ME000202S02758